MASQPKTGREIREVFLRYFEEQGHRILPSSSLVPAGDPTLLFTNAGMVQFKRIFLGEQASSNKRATTSQKCMRVSGKHNDLENVGRTPRHHTFFEMLGNFSFGDYFKEEAIQFAWELITEKLGIPQEKLVASVFREDGEAFDLWRDRIGLPEAKIYRLDEKENFWSMGETGPCGPCSEIHVDFGRPEHCKAEVCDPACECGRWLEIWNLVFMQFNRDAAGEMTPLPAPSIDTGAGLERLAAVLQGVRSNYDTDLFTPLLARAQEISGITLGDDPEKDVSLRVVSDHARAVTFLIGDGVLPSNAGRGYVLRRILRRAARHGVLLGQQRPFLFAVADAVVDEMSSAYPELAERRDYITSRIRREEERFLETLSKGLGLLEEEIEKLTSSREKKLPGDVLFRLYDTYGFPVDLTEDVLRDRGLCIDQAGFDQAMEEQRQRARAAWKGSGEKRESAAVGQLAGSLETCFEGYDTLELDSVVRAIFVNDEAVDVAEAGTKLSFLCDETPFYAESGGQVGDRGSAQNEKVSLEIEDTQKAAGDLIIHHGRVMSGRLALGDALHLAVNPTSRTATVRNHSGTHLLHAALRKVLGPQAMQKGSLVAPDRLRFDFTHDAPLTAQEVAEIERLSNQWIEENYPATVESMSYPKAIEAGAVAIFEEKYGDDVRVVRFGDCSTELCGGTHARATGEIGFLKVLSESGIAAGVRRIEALTGMGALKEVQKQEALLQEAADLLRAPTEEVPQKIARLLEERKEKERELSKLREAARGSLSGNLLDQAKEVSGVKVLASRVDVENPKDLRGMVDDLRAKLASGVVLLVAENDGRVSLALGVTKDLTKTFKAGDLVRELAQLVGGKGGGRPDFAQAGGNDPSAIEAVFERLNQLVAERAGS